MLNTTDKHCLWLVLPVLFIHLCVMLLMPALFFRTALTVLPRQPISLLRPVILMPRTLKRSRCSWLRGFACCMIQCRHDDKSCVMLSVCSSYTVMLKMRRIGSAKRSPLRLPLIVVSILQYLSVNAAMAYLLWLTVCPSDVSKDWTHKVRARTKPSMTRIKTTATFTGGPTVAKRTKA